MSFILTLSGMSTSGKSTLAKKLASTGYFEEAVSLTTRNPRPGEVDGVDYHFVTEDTFNQHVSDGLMLEHVRSHSAQYGVPKSEVDRILAKDKSVVMVLDPIGAKAMRDHTKTTKQEQLAVFLDVPFELLLYRFFNRIMVSLEAGNGINYESEAKRMKTILEQEMFWRNSLEWSLVLGTDSNRGNRAVDLFTAKHLEGPGSSSYGKALPELDSRLAMPKMNREIPMERIKELLVKQIEAPMPMFIFADDLGQLRKEYQYSNRVSLSSKDVYANIKKKIETEASMGF